MLLKNITPLLLLALLMSSACYYNVEEELYPDTGCATDNLTYTASILPILQTNCYACHDQASNFGNVTLEGYDNLKKFVDNGRLLGAIRHTSGFSPMPKDQPQLPGCTIEKIEKWIEDGALDN